MTPPDAPTVDVETGRQRVPTSADMETGRQPPARTPDVQAGEPAGGAAAGGGVDDPAPAGAALAPAAGDRTAWTGGPPYPQAWYMVCRSSELRLGKVVSRDVAGHALVLFRGAGGGPVHALSAHCAHMGAHLGRGTVVGGRIRCPLHHWEYDGSGVTCPPACGRPDDRSPAEAATARQAAYPAAERYGNVFVFNGPRPLFPLPSFGGDAQPEGGASRAASASDAGRANDGAGGAADMAGEHARPLRVGTGRTVSIPCPWGALVANGFDMRHLGAVHGRALREPPVVERLGPHALRLRYVSRVTGRGMSDRVMKRLSGDRIRVEITCWGGTLITVKSDLGRTVSHLLLAVSPTPTGTAVTPLFGLKSSGFGPADALRVAVTRWLFSSFLNKDVAVLHGMRFHVPAVAAPVDEPLRRCVQFLRALPCR